jgi:hypothetical protein
MGSGVIAFYWTGIDEYTPARNVFLGVGLIDDYRTWKYIL